MGTRAIRAVLSLVVVVASIVPARPSISAPAHAAGCSSRGTGGLVSRRSGLDRYSIFVPDGIPAGRSAPLAVMLHGLGAYNGFAGRTGWVPFAAKHRVVVAFPSAPAGTWIRTSGSPDVGFVRRVVAHIRSTVCVDDRRIYVGGVSDGGFFAARLACDAADLFAAVAVVAGGDPGGPGIPCAPSEPVAVSLFHGSADRFFSVSSAAQSRDKWIVRLHCSRTPTVERVPYGPLERYRGCDGHVEVMWRVYDGAPHSWPKGDLRDDALARMWRFFSSNHD